MSNAVTVPADKLAELQRDAARYRWLRDRPELSVFTGERIRFRPFDCPHEIEVGQIGATDLDEAIDAQLAHGVPARGGMALSMAEPLPGADPVTNAAGVTEVAQQPETGGTADGAGT